MTRRRTLGWLLTLSCLLLAGPAALRAEEADLGCLFAAPAAADAPSEPALLVEVGLPAPLPASTRCGGCSPGCAARNVGEACTTFSGAPGHCALTTKICQPSSPHCVCGS
jgi:hypothetical protein